MGEGIRKVYSGNHTLTIRDIKAGQVVFLTSASGAVLTMMSPAKTYRDLQVLVTNDGTTNDVTLSGDSMFIKDEGTKTVGPGVTAQFSCQQDYSGTWRWMSMGDPTASVSAAGAVASGASGIATGGSGIAAGGSGIAAGASGMAVTASGSIYKGWVEWTNPITWSGSLEPDGVVWAGRTRSGSGGVEAVGYLTCTDGSGAIITSIAPPLAWADIDCYVPFLVHQSLISGATTNYTSGAYLLANEANAAGTLAPIRVAAFTSQWSGTLGFRIAYERA